MLMALIQHSAASVVMDSPLLENSNWIQTSFIIKEDETIFLISSNLGYLIFLCQNVEREAFNR